MEGSRVKNVGCDEVSPAMAENKHKTTITESITPKPDMMLRMEWFVVSIGALCSRHLFFGFPS